MLEVSPDLFRRGIEMTPSRIFLPGKLTSITTSALRMKMVLGSYLLAMTWDIASTSWVAVFQPSPADIIVLLVNLKLNVLQEPFSFVCYL
jgi:hypothetical protein